MDSQKLIFKLLYQALIEIREEAHNIKNKKIFFLANLFHNLPLDISNVRSDRESSYEEILESLEQNAEELGISKWLENCKKQL